MPILEAFLLTWVDELIPITKVFPQGYSNKKNLAELLIITKSYLQCGKGSIQHKNKFFYYRTYIPTLISNEESISKKSVTDFFDSSNNSENKKVFILFLCDNNYKKKDIDSLTKKICEILDEGAFDKQDLKKNSTRKINFLYEQYQNLEANRGKFIQMINLDKNNDNDNDNEKNNINNDSSEKDMIINTNNLEENEKRKRSNSRIIWSKNNKSKSQMGSIDINDLTTIKESDSDLSIIFKQSLNENLNFSLMKKMKTIKKVNIILCSVLFVISLVFIILLFIYS